VSVLIRCAVTIPWCNKANVMPYFLQR
jgi:hypothetical protein